VLNLLIRYIFDYFRILLKWTLCIPGFAFPTGGFKKLYESFMNGTGSRDEYSF
jgi:hypothetical protein